MRLLKILICLCFICSCKPSINKEKELLSEANSSTNELPNFIIVYTDDQQFNGIGKYNPVVHTPHINKIMSQSVQFTNAQVAFSLCSPSRAALLTGTYGSRNGVLGLGSRLNNNIKTLPQYLKEKKYISGLSGKWHIKQPPKSVGFDWASYFRSNGTYYNRRIQEDNGETFKVAEHIDSYGVKRSINFLEERAKDKKPFFLFHCPQTPHMNGKLIWDAKEETKAKYDINKIPVPNNYLDNLENKPEYLKKVRNRTKAKDYGYPSEEAIKNHTKDYYSVITELDGFLGNLFDKINTLGLSKNTYIIFMSDNGWMLGDHGFTSKVLPYQTSTHVPLWIVGPTIQKGKNNSIVSNIDILPTILELAEIHPEKNIQGNSLLPIVHKEKNEVRTSFIYEGLGRYGKSKYNLTAISKEYRYIETYEDSLSTVIFQELYNIKNDPFEMSNLAKSEKHTEIIQGLKQKINTFKNNELKNTKFYR